jgi:GTP-binding protein LepA
MPSSPRRVRNFCIIAHVDHGKSTLADRLLEATGAVSKQEMMDQVLDDMPLERERGITIKAHAIAMDYRAADGETYRLNLIDTPGHVDFTYEVSRSLAAAEGALLVVDASQGVEAQTISNMYLAIENNLEIIPVANKIDLPAAHVEETVREMIDLIGGRPESVIHASAKRGIGIEDILERIVRDVPPPSGDPALPLRAFIFDSMFDQYQGVIAYVRVVDGRIRPGMRIRLLATDKTFEVVDVGIFRLRMTRESELLAGDVGWVVANIKNVHDATVGDTIVSAGDADAQPLPGYRPMKPMVWSGLYPIVADDYEVLKDALAKFALNDAAFTFEPETSVALGFGFRAGFLGLLHKEIVQERLEREFNVNLIATTPSVSFRVTRTNSVVEMIHSPVQMPASNEIEQIEEPLMRARIVVPTEHLGNVLALVQERRGIHEAMEFLEDRRAIVTYLLPLAEIVVDFHDKLKSVSRGYASFDYEFAEYRPAPMSRLDILLNGDPVDALSVIVHRDKAEAWGRAVALKLKEVIPRQQFPIAIQAAIGAKVVARETISALRKNVIAKCYGGDITRKRKLLEKQKEGKKRMKQIGSVAVPQEAFLAVLRAES